MQGTSQPIEPTLENTTTPIEETQPAEETQPFKKKRSRGGRKKNKNKDRVAVIPTVGKKLKMKVLQQLSQAVKGLKSYLIQKNVKHIKKAAFKKGSKDRERAGKLEVAEVGQPDDLEDFAEEDVPAEEEEVEEEIEELEKETGAEIRTGKKLGKLEEKLGSLKVLNGKSFRLCAITIARFDLGIEFSTIDYAQYAEEVSFQLNQKQF